MKKRNAVIDKLKKDTEILISKDVLILMKEERIEELEKIVQELDFSYLDRYIDDEEYLDLRRSEIPKGSAIAVAFYFSKTGYDNDEIFDNYANFQAMLKKEGGEKIADKTDDFELKEITTKGFCRLVAAD